MTEEEATVAGDILHNRVAGTISSKEEATTAGDILHSRVADIIRSKEAEAMATGDTLPNRVADIIRNKEVATGTSKVPDMDKEVKADTATIATVAAVEDTAPKTAPTSSRRVESPVSALVATLILSKLPNTPIARAAETKASSRLQCRSSATRASTTFPTPMTNIS